MTEQTATMSPVAILSGKTFKVAHEGTAEEGLAMYTLTSGRVEFLARINADGSVTAFNYNTMGPTQVKGRTIRIAFQNGYFYAA